jgi:glutamate N-acetyltransferase/amino-acid N-acetyltransferase
MPSTQLTFRSREEHRAWLETQSHLPLGFRVGTTRLEFVPVEVPKPARMNLTVIAADSPTSSFAAKFTRNAFPGAPVIVGRARLSEPRLAAWVVNNKISNVCAPGGVEAAEEVSAAAARLLGVGPREVLPSSTGVIGWRLPVKAMVEALPRAVAALQGATILPAAEAILTTDLYPKIRRAAVGEGSIVGIAKGAGMIEPDLATMLVYLLTDLSVPRDQLRAARRWRGASRPSPSTRTRAPPTRWRWSPRCAAPPPTRGPSARRFPAWPATWPRTWSATARGSTTSSTWWFAARRTSGWPGRSGSRW